MARFIGIDWDHDKMFLASGTTGRGSARIDKAVAWRQESTFSPEGLEAAGRRLRQEMKSAGIAPGPVVACLGREHVIFKEIRYPAANIADEPNLVRFQVAKELTEPADRVTIDYTPAAANGDQGNERRATVSVAQKKHTNSLAALCRSAGVKLLSVTPRPFAVASYLENLNGTGDGAPKPQQGTAVAAVVLTASWCEFCVVRDGNVLFSRPMAADDALLSEVRRNLALFSGQMQVSPETGGSVKALYFIGGSEHLVVRQRLQDMLAIPVHPLEPVADLPEDEDDFGGFAGPVGLIHLWAANQQAPINFIAPKEAKVEKGTSRHFHYVLTAGLVAALLILGFVLGQWALAGKKAELEDGQARLAILRGEIKQLEPETKKLDDLAAWQRSNLSWVDEFYRLNQLFPDVEGFRVDSVDITSRDTNNAKDKYTMHMKIQGVVPRSESSRVDILVYMINQDKYRRAKVVKIKSKKDKKSGDKMQEYEISVDIAKTPLEELKMLETPVQTVTAGSRRFGGGAFQRGGRGGFGGFRGGGGQQEGQEQGRIRGGGLGAFRGGGGEKAGEGKEQGRFRGGGFGGFRGGRGQQGGFRGGGGFGGFRGGRGQQGGGARGEPSKKNEDKSGNRGSE